MTIIQNPLQIKNAHLMVLPAVLAVLLALNSILGVGEAAAANHIIYVDAAANAGNSGADWANAYASLQTALSNATAGSEIWVAAGVYKPGAPGNRNATFQLKNGVALYGGFGGGETAREQRDLEGNVTVLSGDIDGNDAVDDKGVTLTINGNNSYNVVTGSGTDASAALDGFTITGGQADGTSAPSQHSGAGVHNESGSPTLNYVIITGNYASGHGGGIYNWSGSSPTLNHVTVSDNSANLGGGMYNLTSSPTLAHMTISNNRAATDGGGIFNNASSPTLTDSTISDNIAGASGGGLFNNLESNPTLMNVTISGNRAYDPDAFNTGFGGGMYNQIRSSPTLNHVVISDNTANSGGGMSNHEGSNPRLTDVTISGNTSLRHGGGMGNRYSSPILINVTFINNSSEEESGGGMSNWYSNPTLMSVAFISNRAEKGGGGGMRNEAGSDPVLTNVAIAGNSARVGGGMNNQGGYDVGFMERTSPRLTNVAITGNSANIGGGMWNWRSDPVLTNVTIAGNSATDRGGGMINESRSFPTIQNSIIWHNHAPTKPSIHNEIDIVPTIRYSLIEGCNANPDWNDDCGVDAGNLLPHVDPLFVAPPHPADVPTTVGNLRLQPGSPAIGVGDNDADLGHGDGATISQIPHDLAGNPRINGQWVDLGAYEAYDPPVAHAGADQTVMVGAEVTLDGRGSDSHDGFTPLVYNWTQTGGATVSLSSATSVQPTFTAPSAPDTLTFELAATDNQGITGAAARVTITVGDVAIAELTADSSSPTTLGQSMAFTASVSGGSNVVYTWDFGDGNGGGGPFATHTFGAAGDYEIIVTATNGAGSSTSTTSVRVTNLPPVAHAGADQTVDVEAPVTLDGSGSHDPDDHTPLAYNWTQTGGPEISLNNATSVHPTFTAPSAPDTLTFDLVVTDSQGLSSAPASVTVVARETVRTLYIPGLVRD